MKNFWDKTITALPYFILLILGVLFLTIILKNELNYEQYVALLDILVWPIIIFATFLFFRKVLFYLFFSIEEFNFFGAKGRLRSVTEVIDQKVQDTLRNEQDAQKRNEELKEIEAKLERAKLSKESSEEKAKENFELANGMLKEYRELLNKSISDTKELNKLRAEKERRDSAREVLRKDSRIHGSLHRHRMDDFPDDENE